MEISNSDLIGLGSIWSSSVDSNLMWIWIGPSDWWIGVDLWLIWLLELQIYTQFELRLRRNRALRGQCVRRSQSATLLTLPLTHCLISSVLAIESRTLGHPALTAVASALAALHLHHCCGVVFDFPASAMERFLSVCPPPPSDDVIFAPKLINSKADDMKEVVELKL